MKEEDLDRIMDLEDDVKQLQYLYKKNPPTSFLNLFVRFIRIIVSTALVQSLLYSFVFIIGLFGALANEIEPIGETALSQFFGSLEALISLVFIFGLFYMLFCAYLEVNSYFKYKKFLREEFI